MALLTVPFIFTQDDLLDTAGFLRAAQERGYQITLDTLQFLHVHGLLVPLYRVSDTAVEGRRIDVGQVALGMNPRGWVLQAAIDGRLRDPMEEGYSVAWPYSRPVGEENRRWWNGFVYSSWQLVDLHDAMRRYSVVRHGWHRCHHRQEVRRRKATLALSALSPRFLPAVLGRLSFPPGTDEEALWRFRSEASTLSLLRVAGLQPAELRPYAEDLLGFASARDPLARLLPLLRHFSFHGWSKLRGEPLDCMWHRVAAEILLQAHDDLAVAGHVDPLPDLTGETWHSSLHDRLTPQYAEAETLERALGDFGLSPYPRVIVLVEGETELNHIPRLLAEFGLTLPQQVRVQRCKGSNVSPQLIARYGVTPRVGRRLPDGWLLDATTTALVIAMDAENRWATPEKCEGERRTLLNAIREEVRSQDADIPDDFLEFLVTVQTWGDDKYELANFTDDELVAAIAQLAGETLNTASPTWRERLRQHLAEARQNHDDIKVPLGRTRLKVGKVELAEALWPTLRHKLEAELAAGRPETPVVKLASTVRAKFVEASGIRAMKTPEP
ncbi:hypothetical protein AB0880_25780 [Micromonospora chersina]|uniref:hypothetical protein n=1 Tax=Micromonospora chersina TaxID=47854 RepID=UPI003453A84A